MRGLTVVNEALERAEQQTVDGMAHWSGGAPSGAKCGDCAFYGYSFTRPNGDPMSKRSSCEKFWRFTGRHGGSISKTQIGCKYFSAAKTDR